MLSPLATVVYNHFEEITDPRLNRGLNHDLGELMFIALTAALANADSWADVERFGTSHQDWFAKHLPLENGIPSHDTFSRVFARLDSGEFLTAMHRWIDDFSDSLRGQGIAIDGKTLRGSRRPARPVALAHHHRVRLRYQNRPATDVGPRQEQRNSRRPVAVADARSGRCHGDAGRDALPA